MKKVDGNSIAKYKEFVIAQDINNFERQHNRRPKLVVILANDNAASKIYVKNKEKAAKRCGIDCETYDVPNIEQKELENLIRKLNNDNNVDGIMLQLPVNDEIYDKEAVINEIDPLKDVDGLTLTNKTNLALSNLYGKQYMYFVPCTVNAIFDILQDINVDVHGLNVTVIGRSDLVGKPLSLILGSKQCGATVTTCHTDTANLADYTRISDIIIVAAGKPGLVTEDMIKEGAIIIDVGINKINNKIVGDCDINIDNTKASYVTPVPGGVGPLTVTNLMRNTLRAAYRNNRR